MVHTQYEAGCAPEPVYTLRTKHMPRHYTDYVEVDDLWELDWYLVTQWPLEITWNETGPRTYQPGLFRTLEHPNRQMLSERNISV
jgi:hypothetical protein